MLRIMFSVFVLSSLVTVVQAQSVMPVAEADRYRTNEGVISFTKLGSVVATALRTDVQILAIRWAHNPVAVVYWALTGGHPQYVFELLLPGSHRAECYFALNPRTKDFYFGACTSETANVNLPFVLDSYDKIMLP